MNLVFGSVWISEAWAINTSLLIDLAGTSKSYKVGKKDSIMSFQFSLTKDVWKHDIFELGIDGAWTVASGAVCRSVLYVGTVNNVNGSRVNDPHNLDCVVTSKATSTTEQSVYVYGLNTDLDVSSGDNYKNVDLNVYSVSNPDRDYNEATYNWSF
jgi:hypothetical protein